MKAHGVRIALAIGIIRYLAACEKKPLPLKEENNTPDFYMEAVINGEKIKIGAGEENYFMYSSYFLDTNQVYVLKSQLQQTSCTPTCGFALTVLLNDNKLSTLQDTICITQTLHKGTYVYRDNQLPPLLYQATLKPLRGESQSEKYRWVLNGKEINSYTASEVVESGDYFLPVLNFEDAEGICATSHAKQFKVGNPLQSTIEVQKEGLPDVLMYSFSAINKGTPPYRYTWQFGDGSSSASQQPFHTYSSQGFYTAKLTLTDANGDTCVSFYQVPAFIEPRCEANFTASFTPLPNTKAFSTITVLLTHPDGRVFSSQELVQPANSHFEILEISDYEVNINGEPTKRMKIRFNCTVQNNFEQLKIENAEAVLAVSYK